MWWMAKLYANSGMVPKAYDGKPENIMVAWMMGADLGLGHTASLQNIAVINGTPSVFGDAQLAIAKGSGEIESISEFYEGDQFLKDGKENDDFTAVCVVKTKDGNITTERFSVKDAKIAKLWMKKGAQGGESPWCGYWRRMMKMRARSWALRDSVPGALKGIRTREELESDFTPQEERTFTVKAPSQSDVASASIDTDIVEDAEVIETPSKPEEKKPEAPKEEVVDAHWRNEIIDEFKKQAGLTEGEAREFIEISAKENDLSVAEIISDMEGSLTLYLEAAVKFFNKDTKMEEVENEPSLPSAEQAMEDAKMSASEAEDEQGLKDAGLILGLAKCTKEQFETAFKKDTAIPRMAEALLDTRKRVYLMWKGHGLGPCPFYQEVQDDLPIATPPGAKSSPQYGPLPMVPADYPPSPDRKYSFALSNARKKYPDAAEIAREELKYGRLVMSEDGAKNWYEKIVEVLGRPPKKEKKK
jgi:hypothetical protein